mgnify:CR=1 FL=1
MMKGEKVESERQRIKRMLDEGKITSRQAELLLDAFDVSRNRRERIFREVIIQRKKREGRMWKVFGGWCLIIVLLAGGLIYRGGGEGISRETFGGQEYFRHASYYLARGDYKNAVRYCRRGTKEAPFFPLGYSLLGASYKLLYTQTQDLSVNERAEKTFKKAEKLSTRLTRRRNMEAVARFFTFVLLVLILGAITIILLFIYNVLVRKEENVNQAWAQIQVQFQRKLDLIPALLEAVKGYTQHENQTYKDVVHTRSEAQAEIENMEGGKVSKEKLERLSRSQGVLRAALSKLFALVENYPDLKAGENFLTIQKQLQEIEDRIAGARETYNQSVKSYNMFLKGFPGNLVGALFRFYPREYFESQGGVS